MLRSLDFQNISHVCSLWYRTTMVTSHRCVYNPHSVCSLPYDSLYYLVVAFDTVVECYRSLQTQWSGYFKLAAAKYNRFSAYFMRIWSCFQFIVCPQVVRHSIYRSQSIVQKINKRREPKYNISTLQRLFCITPVFSQFIVLSVLIIYSSPKNCVMMSCYH